MPTGISHMDVPETAPGSECPPLQQRIAYRLHASHLNRNHDLVTIPIGIFFTPATVLCGTPGPNEPTSRQAGLVGVGGREPKPIGPLHIYIALVVGLLAARMRINRKNRRRAAMSAGSPIPGNPSKGVFGYVAEKNRGIRNIHCKMAIKRCECERR